jgi:MFS family permease
MDILDTTVVLVALPSLQRSLDVGASTLQWTVAGYTLAFALLLITGGRLGDSFGRKRIFLTGLAGFTVASVLTRTAQSAGMLTQADLFGWGWRPIFLINLPVGILALVGASVLLPESRAARPPRLDPVGALIATAGLLALLYPLVQGHELGWPTWTYALMAAAVPVLALFVAYERHKTRKDASPLVELELFRYRGVVGGLLIALLFFAGAGYSFVLTMHLQEGLGFTPLGTALAFLPFSLGVVAGSGPPWRWCRGSVAGS